MRSIINRTIAGVFVMVLGISPAWAIPTLSFDLDITTSGIQSSRNVLLGDSFNVAVLLSGYDITTLIDTVSFDVNYNDSGMVLTGVGSPVAGALVDRSPIETLDAFTLPFTGADLNQGNVLSTLDLGLAAGYLSNFAYFSYSSLTDPFNLVGSDPITVALFNFTASTLGASTLFMAVDPAALSVAGAAVDVSLGNGRVNVISASAVPEPGILLLFGAGMIGLWASRLRQRHY